ncbi:MAG: hypothetical protein HY810_06905 [Candidatus Omnitrophica bacterium]|nr:hypothetical protein [Candidatus Omnitrophota bacterium]
MAIEKYNEYEEKRSYLYEDDLTYDELVEEEPADEDVEYYEEDYDEDDYGSEYETVVKGNYRFNFGAEEDDFIWKDANYLLQPGSWRYLYGEKRHNTYDLAVFNQLKIAIDAPVTEKFSFYTKVVIDPWSFVGKTQKISLASWYGTTNADDPVEIQLKYWSNSGRTYPEIVRSEKGDSFALPEIKAVDGSTSKTNNVLGSWGSWTHRVDIPQLKLDTEFKPLRALWFDYKEDEYRAILFLYAQDNIAMYTDDPLWLVNNHIVWEPSPWLNSWKAGKLYTSSGWENGSWQRDLFLADSERNWLTCLHYYGLFGLKVKLPAFIMILW